MSSAPTPTPPRADPHWWALAALVALLIGGGVARSVLGLEWSADSIRTLVAGFGVWGPLLYIVLLAFRFLIFIPSVILLAAGGLIFGALPGTLFGAIGLTAGGLFKYAVVRWAGAESLRAQVPRPYQPLLALARGRAGGAGVALISAYPIGPVGAVHIAAAITGMTLLTFVLAVSVGSLARSALFSYFGHALVEGEGLWWASAALAGALVVPLLFPGVRRWLAASTRAPIQGDG